MPSRVVYTALFGDTEKLLEQEAKKKSSVRFICFTDNPALKSATWEIVQVDPLFPADPRRSQRDIKIRGHELLRAFDQWLYIDNTVRLKTTPEEILDQWLADADWAALSHDANHTIWEEFEANLALAKETPERINEQLNDYSTFHPDALSQHPLWNGMFARKNNPAVESFASLWFAHVLRYSARDQLSMVVALSQRPLVVNRIEGRIRNSPWHDWPHRTGETTKSKSTRHARTSGLKPLAEELAATREKITELSTELEKSNQRIRSLTNRHWFGIVGVARWVNSVIRARKVAKKKAKKLR